METEPTFGNSVRHQGLVGRRASESWAEHAWAALYAPGSTLLRIRNAITSAVDNPTTDISDQRWWEAGEGMSALWTTTSVRQRVPDLTHDEANEVKTFANRALALKGAAVNSALWAYVNSTYSARKVRGHYVAMSPQGTRRHAQAVMSLRSGKAWVLPNRKSSKGISASTFGDGEFRVAGFVAFPVVRGQLNNVSSGVLRSIVDELERIGLLPSVTFR